MGTALKQVVQVTRHEYRVPCNARGYVAISEVVKAHAWARQDAEQAGLDISFDDTIKVRPDDDAVVLYFETEAQVVKP